MKTLTFWLGILCISVGCISTRASLESPPSPKLPPSGEQRSIPAGLALATFDSVWHVVARTYVDTAFVSGQWKMVRASVRPLAAATTSREGLQGVIAETLRHIPDSHFYIIPGDVANDVAATGDGEGGEGTTGISVRIADSGVFVWRVEPGSPGAIAGVRPGRRVERIGERVVSTSLAGIAALPDVSRQRAKSQLLQRLNGALSPSVGDTVRIRLAESAKTGRATFSEVALAAMKVGGTVSKFGNLPPIAGRVRATRQAVVVAGTSRRDSCIGTIAFNIWLPVLAPELERAVNQVADCAGIIIDLRGNPGGVGAMVMGFGGYFVGSPMSLGTMRTRDVSLQFLINPRFIQSDGFRRAPYTGPVAILVDPLTASTSEIFATGMQRLGRMRVFGERSAGAALPALMQRLPSGDVFVHAVADFTDPDGRRIEGTGVVADENVPITEKDLLQGVDAPFEAAARWISTHSNTLK